MKSRKLAGFADENNALLDALTVQRSPSGTGDTHNASLSISAGQSADAHSMRTGSVPVAPNLSQVHWDSYMANPLYQGVDGRGITIAVLDTGIDAMHAAFAGGRIAYQYDFVDGDGIAQDDNGHGTHVASIAGGYDPGLYAGIAKGVSFVVLKVMDASGRGSGETLLDALNWVNANAAKYNIAAVNMSLGFGVNDQTARSDFMTSALAALYQKGVVTVGAAGNGYQLDQLEGVDYPGSDPYSWAIGAVNSTGPFFDYLAPFSQRSSTLMDLAAPGTNIVGAKAGGGYMSLSGTSMATPAVTGAVALAEDLAQQISGRKLSVAALREVMRDGAVAITDTEIADGVRNTGKQYLRLDIQGMLDKVVAYFQKATAGDDQLWGWRGNDSLTGGDGNDTLAGGDGNNTLDGGGGVDLAVFDKLTYSESIIVKTTDGTVMVGNDLLKSIERVRFSDGIIRDLETGKPSSPHGSGDTASPPPGNQRLLGTRGDDHLVGGTGDDTLAGRGGSDTLDGGAGTDTVSYAGYAKGAMIDLGAGSTRFIGAAAMDRLVAIENIIGTDRNDTIAGDDAANVLNGRAGRDVVDGRGGDDTIIGGAGNDVLTGGSGADSFVFARGWGRDTITDLDSEDVIDFTKLRLAGDVTRLQIDDSGPDLKIGFGVNSLVLQGFDRLAWDTMVASKHVLL